MADDEENKSKEIVAKNNADRESAVEKSRQLSKGIFRSAETLNANAEKRRVRDDRAFSPVNSWKQIPGAISARALRGAEVRLLQPFGMAGEAIFQARRANVGQKLTAAKNVIKLNIMSRIGGGGVIGEYFANKMGNSVDFSEDPTKLAASFKITAEAISHELLSVNNRFKANENSINSLQESVKKIEASLDDTLKGMQQHLDPIKKTANEALQKANELETSFEGRFTSIDGEVTEIKSNYARLDTRLTILEEKFTKNLGDTTRDGKRRKTSSRLQKTKQEHAENTTQKDFDPFTFQDLAEKKKKKESASTDRNTLFSGVPVHLLKGLLKGGVRGGVDAIGEALAGGAGGIGGILLGRFGGTMLRAAPGVGAASLLAYQLYKSLSETPDAERGKKLEEGTHGQGFTENLWKNLDGRNARDKLEYYKKLRDSKAPQTRVPWIDDAVKNPKRMMGIDKSQQNFEQQQKALAEEILKKQDLGIGPKLDQKSLKMEGQMGPFFMFDQGRESKNVKDVREHSFVTRKIVENDFVKHYQAQQREEMKKNFMLFGKMPGGFEFVDGHMGRLGMPSAVAATGAMPLSGFGSGGSYNGQSGGASTPLGGGTRFTGPQGFGAPSPAGSGIPMVDPSTPRQSYWKSPGGTNIGQSQVGVDVGPMTVDRSGRVKPEQYYQAALQKLEGSKLIGFVPRDGERFGIKTGSKEEWARFMTQLTRQESNFNTLTIGDGGNSIGLSQMKAGEYGIKNPHDPHQAQSGMIKQFEKYVIASGHITGQGSGPGTYGGWKGVAAYYGPLRREREFFRHNQFMEQLRPTLDNIGTGLPQLSLPSEQALSEVKPPATSSNGEQLKSQSNKPNVELKYVDRTSEMGSRYGMRDGKPQPYEHIGVHYTGGKTLQSAVAQAKLTNIGYQYIIDKDGSVHIMQDSDKGRSNHWGTDTNNMHPTAKNYNSVGVSYVGMGNDISPEQKAAGLQLIKNLQQKYNIKPENVLGHGEVGSKGHRNATEGYELLSPYRAEMGLTPTTGKRPNIANPDGMKAWETAKYEETSRIATLDSSQLPNPISIPNPRDESASFGVDKSHIMSGFGFRDRIQERGAFPEITDQMQSLRPNHFTGKINLNGKTYDYGTGSRYADGGPMRGGSIPFGTFGINSGLHYGANPRFQGNSFRVNDMFDPKWGRTRTAILFHSARDLDRLYSAGCIAVKPDQWEDFKANLLEQQKKHGSMVLTVNPDGSSFVYPKDQPPPGIARTVLSSEAFINNNRSLVTTVPSAVLETAGISSQDIASFQGEEPVSNVSDANRPLGVQNESMVPDGAQLSDAASAGFSEADTKPVSGLDTIAGVPAPAPVDVLSASPEKPAIAEASEAPASVEETDFSTARTEDPTEGGSRSSSEATDRSMPQGGGRYNPESENAKPGSSGYGSKGRCYIALFCLSIGLSSIFLERTNVEYRESSPIIQETYSRISM